MELVTSKEIAKVIGTDKFGFIGTFIGWILLRLLRISQWTYFFNAKTFLIVAAKVFHSPTVSFIENIKFNKETPFVFNAERESVFLNKDGSKDYLRASYFYSNYKVVLKN